MNSYNFPMEKVLELRVNKEKDIMEKFANLQNDLLKQKSELDNYKKQLEGLKLSGQKCINIDELKQQLLYKQSIEEKVKEQNEKVQLASNHLENVRFDLISAQQDRKIMEKLKEKDFFMYQNDIKIFEQKQIDEIAILKFNRIES